MTVYLYDGTYPGLLTCLQTCFDTGIVPETICTLAQSEPSLFADEVVIKTDPQKTENLIDRMKCHFLPGTLRNIFYTFLSDASAREMIIYRYAAFGFEVGKTLDNYISDDRVRAVHALSRKVGGETHRMKGLIRFQTLQNGMYYARIRPDHNIIPLLGRYFSQRLPDQYWMIHDVRRNIALIYNKKYWDITQVEINYEPDLAHDELFCQQLWKQYFHTIAIKERRNPKLQRQLMPARYWEFLVEMQK